MEKKIDIAELLKDCPKGMELNCTICDDFYFSEISNDIPQFPIRCYYKHNGYTNMVSLTREGKLSNSDAYKCIIFPKGKTTWEGFVPPCKIKNGDVVVNASNKNSNAFIYAGENDYYYECYVGLMTGTDPELSIYKSVAWVSKESGIRLATEEEKQKLFDAIKANGYKWNSETKTLEKLIEPEFKVGDVIQDEDGYKVKITEVNREDERYRYESMISKRIGSIVFSKRDAYELVPNKFDITTLKPFESRVLVRDSSVGIWLPEFFACVCDNHDCPYMIIGGTRWRCCIPFEGNEHLMCKTDDCDEFYKNW